MCDVSTVLLVEYWNPMAPAWSQLEGPRKSLATLHEQLKTGGYYL